MQFEGNPDVLTNLFLKKRLLAEEVPEEAQFRPVLLALGGVMRGVYGGAQVMALEHFDLTSIFDQVIGVSTGAPIAAYFLARQSELGTSIYVEECTTPAFISVSRGLRGGAFVDLDYITGVFRGESSAKTLDQRRVYESRTAMYVGVTEAQSGRGVLLSATCARPDIVQAIRASIAIPGNGPPVTIAGTAFLDGGVGCPLPGHAILERFKPTDLLILANREERHREDGFIRRLLEPGMLRGVTGSFRAAVDRRQELFDAELAYLRAQVDCRVAIIWADGAVRATCRTRNTLRDAVDRSFRHAVQLLARAERRAAYL